MSKREGYSIGEGEEAWLNEVMEYYMIRSGLYSPPK